MKPFCSSPPKVNIIYLVAEAGLDGRIWPIINSKSAVSSKLLDVGFMQHESFSREPHRILSLQLLEVEAARKTIDLVYHGCFVTFRLFEPFLAIE